MLFEIINLQSINAKNKTQKIDVLEKLLNCYLKGDHYVWINRNEINILKNVTKKNLNISKYQQAVLSLQQDLNEGKSLIENLNFFIKIDFSDLHNSDSTNLHQNTIDSNFLIINYTKFLNKKFEQVTKLITENYSDANALQILSEVYKDNDPILKNLKINFEPEHGGGEETYKVFEMKKNTYIALCISDSDMKFHKDCYKGTSKKIQKVKITENDIAKHQILDCHETENLFPPSIWKAVYKSKNPTGAIFTTKFLQSTRKDFVRYIDYKNGLSKNDVETHNNPAFKKYWSSFSEYPNIEDVICSPLGTKCLVDLHEKYKNEPNFQKEISRLLSQSEFKYWESYALTICSWAIAKNRINVT